MKIVVQINEANQKREKDTVVREREGERWQSNDIGAVTTGRLEGWQREKKKLDSN